LQARKICWASRDEAEATIRSLGGFCPNLEKLELCPFFAEIEDSRIHSFLVPIQPLAALSRLKLLDMTDYIRMVPQVEPNAVKEIALNNPELAEIHVWFRSIDDLPALL
jgi:hypothetical protein